MAYCRTSHLFFLASITLMNYRSVSSDVQSNSDKFGRDMCSSMAGGVDNGACGGATTTTQAPTTEAGVKKGKLVVEEIPEEDNERYYHDFFGKFMTVDNCTIDECGIDIEKLRDAFWELYLTDKSRHAAAMAMLEPAMFIHMGKIKQAKNN